MGILKKLTSEYFGKTERLEDRVVMNGVEMVDFTDKNGRRHKKGYKVVYGNRNTLIKLIKKLVDKRGPECDLNDVDVSEVKNMGNLFYTSHFNGDISGWDVSKVIDMHCMFFNSDFNGNVSGWDVSNVIDMSYTFFNSQFNGDVSKWKVWNVKNMCGMFRSSAFTGENGDISGWKVNPDCKMMEMFFNTPLKNGLPEWYNNRKK
jgi:surface protein